MPDAPHYLIGQGKSPEPWIQTPDFLHDRARRVHNGLLNLNDELSKLAGAGRLDMKGSRWQAWKRLLNVWGTWYGDSGPTTWLWSGTAATLDHYEQEIADWQNWVRKLYPDVAPQLAPAPMQYNPHGQPKSSIPWWAWAAGGAIATGVLIATLRK